VSVLLVAQTLHARCLHLALRILVLYSGNFTINFIPNGRFWL